jgi:tetratricopeptide (TPR) repeat protein
MFLDGGGAEVDWIVGYGPPPEKFQERLAKIIAGVDTFKSLKASYAKNPNDAAVAFKLARKYVDRFDNAKAMDLYKAVLALDPDGKSGSYTNDYTKVTVSYTEFAALQVAYQALSTAPPTVKPLRDFIAKYPATPLIKDAYSRMAGYYGQIASKEEAGTFFEEYAAKFSEDTAILDQWLARILKDQGPYEKGAEIAEKLQKTRRGLATPDPNQNVAELYMLKGDKPKAEEIYGKAYIERQASFLAYNMLDYARYWIGKNENKDSALAMVEKALTLQPDTTDIVQQAAGVYLKMKMDDKALSIYGPAFARKNWANPDVISAYGSFWSRQGKNLEDALAATQKAVELKPSVYYLWTRLSGVQNILGNSAEAVKAMERAMELAPDSVKDYYAKEIEKLKAGAKKK